MRTRRALSVVAAIVALLISTIGMAMPANAVDAQFLPSTADQSPGSLSITGFADTDELLVGVAFQSAPAGTTFRFTSTTGLTPAYGFTFTSTLTSITFTGTKTAANAALATMLVSTGSSEGSFTINLTATLTQANTYYNAASNHYYKYVADSGSWTTASNSAAATTYNGATGYLTTITTAAENDFVKSYVSATNIWIGASDRAAEGSWKWETGPEAGTLFWQGASGGNTTAPYNFASWASGEPNDYGSGEDYAVTNWSGSRGLWNDLPDTAGGISGYLIEFSPPSAGYTGVSSTQRTAAVGISSSATTDTTGPVLLPPPWLQAYGRAKTEACRPGWHPSWAEWAVAKTGGWVCHRTVLWDGATWVQNPNAVWGTMDQSLSTPWDGA